MGNLLVAGGELDDGALDVDALVLAVLVLKDELIGGLGVDEGGEEEEHERQQE